MDTGEFGAFYSSIGCARSLAKTGGSDERKVCVHVWPEPRLPMHGARGAQGQNRDSYGKTALDISAESRGGEAFEVLVKSMGLEVGPEGGTLSDDASPPYGGSPTGGGSPPGNTRTCEATMNGCSSSPTWAASTIKTYASDSRAGEGSRLPLIRGQPRPSKPAPAL